MAQPSSPPRLNNRLGRTAWLVMLVGLFSSAAMLGVLWFFGGAEGWNGRQDLYPAYGVALALAGVSYVWSLSLGCRALWRGEGSALPVWLFNFATLPPAAYAFAHWFALPRHVFLNPLWLYALYLPVLLPVFSFAFISGTLIFWPLVRHLERRRVDAGKPPSTRVRRGLVTALMMGAYALLLALIVAPVPMVMLSCINTQIGVNSPLTYSPEFVCDLAESVLSLEPSRYWRTGRLILLRSGRVSEARLKLRLRDADSRVCLEALLGAYKRDSAVGMKFSNDIIWDRTFARGTTLRENALRSLAWTGNRDERRSFLQRAVRENSPDLNTFLIRMIDGRKDVQLIPDLKEVLKSNAAGKEVALVLLAKLLPADQAEALLIEAINAGGATCQAVVWYFNSDNDALMERIFLHLVDHSDIAMRREALRYLDNCRAEPRPSDIVIARRVLKMLSSDDLPERRGAALRLRSILNRNSQSVVISWEGLEEIYYPANPALPVENGGAPAPETEDERAAIKRVRDATEAWLKKQDAK